MTMVDLKNDRDENEVLTVSKIESEFESIIGYEESLFDNFSKHFQVIKPRIKEIYNKSGFQEVVLNALMDRWAFWLDKAVTKKLPLDEAVDDLNHLVEDFMFPENSEPALLDILDCPTHLVSIGKLYLDKSMWSLILGTVWTDNTYASNSLPFFEKAITILGSCNHTIPSYYKAFALILQPGEFEENNKKAEVKALLRSVERGFRSRISEECSHVSLVTSVSETYPPNQTQSFIQVEAFKDQRKNMISLYQLFIDSIHDILGRNLIPDHFQTLKVNTQAQVLELLAQLASCSLIRNCSVVDLPPCNKAAFPSGVPNRLIFKCINPDIQLLEEIATAYGLRSSDLHEAVYALREECGNNFEISNGDIKQVFEDRLRLPNRMEFWKALVKSKVVSEPKTVALLNDPDAIILNPIYDKLKKMKFVEGIIKVEVKGHLFYNNVPPNSQEVEKGFLINLTYKEALLNKDLLNLRKQGLINLNQYGKWTSDNLDEMTTELEYDCHYLLKYEYALVFFAERGIPVDLLDYNIFYYLIEQGLINSRGLLMHTNFEQVDWGKYLMFKDELISVIQLHCIYRMYVLYLIKEFESSSNEAVDLSFFNTDPCCAIVNELFHYGILRRYRITSDTFKPPDDENLAQTNYKSTLRSLSFLTKKDLVKFFKRANIPLTSLEAFWFHLISMNWLVVKGIGYEDENPSEGKLNLPKNFKAKDLQEPWNSPEIINFLLVRSSLIHERQSILRSLEQFTSRLNLIKEPDGNLQKIESKLSKQLAERLSSEVVMMQSIGLDTVMNIFDRKWSPIRAQSSPSNASNYLQIAAGIAMSVYSVGFGTFSGQLLIDQGISDLTLALTSMFTDQLALEGYYSNKITQTSALISMISPAVSMYLLGTGSYTGHLGYKIVSSAAHGQSNWLRITSSAAQQIGKEVIKIVISETHFTTEALSIEQKIKSKYAQLVEEIEQKMQQQVEDFMNSEAVTNLCLRIGNDEARSEIILTLTQENFGAQEWLQVENLVSIYAENELEQARNWTFEKKNSTSKFQIYLKNVERFFQWGKEEGGGGGSRSLTEDLWEPIHLLLNHCMHSLNSTPSSSVKAKTNGAKYEQTFMVFELSNILTRHVEDILYEHLLFPICNSVTDNFMRDADASLIRQLSQSRKNLVKNFTMHRNVNRSFVPKLDDKDSRNSESVDYDRIEELRMKQLCKKLFKLEQKCADPHLLSEFVRAELCCGHILLQACSNCYNCKFILRERTEGSRLIKKLEIIPANPKQGEEQKWICLDLPKQTLFTQDENSKMTAAKLLEMREKSQRQILDLLIVKLRNSEIISENVTREELRHKLADIIKSDVAILVALRNMRMHRNK